LRGSKACQKIHNRLVNPQSTDRAGVVAETHYDVGNDLFERMLDPLMIYSGGELAK
jgi:cyclopropane-fatty-acyl-phospholipid synthase